jgi:hypothetical protein
MLYLGIDQHARQITISLRDEGGDVLQARQVSTQPEKVRAFFEQLDGIQAKPHGPWWVRLTPELIAELRKPVRRRWKKRSSR